MSKNNKQKKTKTITTVPMGHWPIGPLGHWDNGKQKQTKQKTKTRVANSPLGDSSSKQYLY